MKKVLLTLFIFSFLIIAGKAQTTHVIETVGNTFSPANITISEGDIVRWENTGGGIHDVEADDGSFDSGAPSGSNWTFEYTFNTPGAFGYFCSVHGSAGGVGMAGRVTVQPLTSVDDSRLVTEYRLEQNYPNPFNPATTIRFSVPEAGFTELKVYNLAGQEVMTVLSNYIEAGNYSTKINAGNLSSGVYIYRLQSSDFAAVRKFTLIK